MRCVVFLCPDLSNLHEYIYYIHCERFSLTAGAGLALAGVIMQASVQNPLAEPFILGIASGASVGATLAILIGTAAIPLGVPGAAFLRAILATLAVTLGIDASAKRRLYMGLLALLTGVLVATCGIIGFVGLVVPHLVRAFTGASHRRLLPAALLVGAIFLVVADLLARTLLAAGDLPIGIITALIGAPLFMKLLFGSSGNFGGGR